MSIRPDERISFVLSGLSREQQNTRRRTTPAEDFAARSAAAVAGACADLDVESSGGYEDDGGRATHVDAKRDNPPKLKGKRTFCTTLVALWTACTTAVALLLVLQTFNSKFWESDVDQAIERRLARDDTIKDRVLFGVWDSRQSITPLQLQVAVSMALGVRASDGDIRVEADENSFFEISVDHATVEEVEYIAGAAFMERLNTQMAHYGGSGVLSKPPKLLRNTTGG
jgi:hypothetical protein